MLKGKCCKCGSQAINDHLHGRMPGVDIHLCDVCYWRSRCERNMAEVTVSLKDTEEFTVAIENWKRLEHAIKNIQIQVAEGSEARVICDRVLAGEFYPET